MFHFYKLLQIYTKTKRNNQTTSTKCQYQDANSKPKWCLTVKWKFKNLIKQTNIKILPIITCSPCNPVKEKNADPYTLSVILKGAFKYSPTCKPVNKIAKNNVTTKP